MDNDRHAANVVPQQRSQSPSHELAHPRINGDHESIPENAPNATHASRAPIVAPAEVTRRMLLLADLQAALEFNEVHSVLARNHRLVLTSGRAPCEPSGPTDPQLHIFTPDGTDIATTDGITYTLASGHECPASNPHAAATMIRQRIFNRTTFSEEST